MFTQRYTQCHTRPVSTQQLNKLEHHILRNLKNELPITHAATLLPSSGHLLSIIAQLLHTTLGDFNFR